MSASRQLSRPSAMAAAGSTASMGSVMASGMIMVRMSMNTMASRPRAKKNSTR